MEKSRFLPLYCNNEGVFDDPENISVYLRREITELVRTNILRTSDDLRQWFNQHFSNAHQIHVNDTFIPQIKRELDAIPEAESACASLDEIIKTNSPDLFQLLHHIVDPKIWSTEHNVRSMLMPLLHLHPLLVDEVRLRVIQCLLSAYRRKQISYWGVMSGAGEMVRQSMQCGGNRLPQIRAVWGDICKEVKKQVHRNTAVGFYYPFAEDAWERRGVM